MSTVQSQGVPIWLDISLIIIVILEPVGSSSPKIHNKDIRIRSESRNSRVGLECEGQSFPAPTYRYILKSIQFFIVKEPINLNKNLVKFFQLRLYIAGYMNCNNEMFISIKQPKGAH